MLVYMQQGSYEFIVDWTLTSVWLAQFCTVSVNRTVVTAVTLLWAPCNVIISIKLKVRFTLDDITVADSFIQTISSFT